MEVKLDDKFLRTEGAILLTGIEAIVRLALDKQRRDQAELGKSSSSGLAMGSHSSGEPVPLPGSGHVNRTFFSGYEGSPLGGLDLEIAENLELLNRLGQTIHQFGINEKTAASAMLGTQYAPGGDVDAFWYGKAHGAMWIPDEVWLANLAGTRGRGAMVLLCGEDHRSKSSVSPGASDWVLQSSMVPTFYPASVEEILSLGMHAIALSRWLGVVCALKLVTPVCDGASTVRAGASRVEIKLPGPYPKRFNEIVMATGALPMQRELVERKLPLVEEYLRLNQINCIHSGEGEEGLIATGKSYTDVRQALEAMEISAPVLQLSAIFPLDKEIVRCFAQGLRRIYVVEEPGPFVEDGIKAALWGTGVEGVYGKRDEQGKAFIPAWGELDPEVLAGLLWPKLKASRTDAPLASVERLLERRYPQVPLVSPMSCGGCPYNVFRDLEEKPGGEIGCSSIRAIDAYDNGVLYIPTMGAGGAMYSGTAPFNGNRHIFQYLGDGSYFHSGRGAIQACVQAKVNITFLLLFNGAVALTGGQKPGGQRPVPEVVRELLALGVERVGVVSEAPRQYRGHSRVEVFGLDRHPEALRRFGQLAGTTALILDKECATEKMRRRRRQNLKPAAHVLIHEELCEGCGDCFHQSEGCAALYPVETEFGEKTQIRQANCTQDRLCVDGECPAFMAVSGAGLRRRQPEELGEMPEPRQHSMGAAYTILALGRGGTGVITISHLLAYAALMEGKKVYLANNTGLAQKGGPVEAPIVLSQTTQPVFNRLFPGSADLYLGFDLLRAAEPGNLKYASPERSLALVSAAQVPTARMNRHPEEKFPDPEQLKALIDGCTRKSANIYLDTYWLAERLFADILFANMLLLGAAYQAGALPLRAASIEAAIALNGKAVRQNIQAFRWGRLAVADPGRVETALGSQTENRRWPAPLQPHDQALDEIVLDEEGRRQLEVRFAELCQYQDAAYARQYRDFVRRVWQAEQRFADRGHALTRAVIFNLYKLMAYKDEYEVARLATRPESEARVRGQFDGPVRVSYYLHPPTLRFLFRKKLRLGPWFRPALVALKHLKALRGTAFDLFGHAPCRKLERELIGWYRGVMEEVLGAVDEGNYHLAVQLARLPDRIRGYEQVKMKSAAQARQEAGRLLAQFRESARGS